MVFSQLTGDWAVSQFPIPVTESVRLSLDQETTVGPISCGQGYRYLSSNTTIGAWLERNHQEKESAAQVGVSKRYLLHYPDSQRQTETEQTLFISFIFLA